MDSNRLGVLSVVPGPGELILACIPVTPEVEFLQPSCFFTLSLKSHPVTFKHSLLPLVLYLVLTHLLLSLPLFGSLQYICLSPGSISVIQVHNVLPVLSSLHLVSLLSLKGLIRPDGSVLCKPLKRVMQWSRAFRLNTVCFSCGRGVHLSLSLTLSLCKSQFRFRSSKCGYFAK